MDLNSQEQHRTSQLPVNPQAQIMALLNEARVAGRIDSEPEAFQSILSELSSGAIKPEDALKRAQKIMNSRQDYN